MSFTFTSSNVSPGGPVNWHIYVWRGEFEFQGLENKLDWATRCSSPPLRVCARWTSERLAEQFHRTSPLFSSYFLVRLDTHWLACLLREAALLLFVCARACVCVYVCHQGENKAAGGVHCSTHKHTKRVSLHVACTSRLPLQKNNNIVFIFLAVTASSFSLPIRTNRC